MVASTSHAALGDGVGGTVGGIAQKVPPPHMEHWSALESHHPPPGDVPVVWWRRGGAGERAGRGSWTRLEGGEGRAKATGACGGGARRAVGPSDDRLTRHVLHAVEELVKSLDQWQQ